MQQQEYDDISKDMRTIMAFLQLIKHDAAYKKMKAAREAFSPVITEKRKTLIIDQLGEVNEILATLDTAAARAEMKKINQILKTLISVS